MQGQATARLVLAPLIATLGIVFFTYNIFTGADVSTAQSFDSKMWWACFAGGAIIFGWLLGTTGFTARKQTDKGFASPVAEVPSVNFFYAVSGLLIVSISVFGLLFRFGSIGGVSRFALLVLGAVGLAATFYFYRAYLISFRSLILYQKAAKIFFEKLPGPKGGELMLRFELKDFGVSNPIEFEATCVRFEENSSEVLWKREKSGKFEAQTSSARVDFHLPPYQESSRDFLWKLKVSTSDPKGQIELEFMLPIDGVPKV
jgi:hypothetical protein